MQHLDIAIRGMKTYTGQRRFGSWRIFSLARNLHSAFADAKGTERNDGEEARCLLATAEQEIRAMMEMAPEPDAEALAVVLHHLREAATALG